MSDGGSLTVYADPVAVSRVLRDMPGCEKAVLEDGDLALWFGDEQVAYVGQGAAGEETDIVVKDWSDTLGRRIFEYLEPRMDGEIELYSSGSEMIRGRRRVTA
jgi:hypothetical protein